MKTPLLLLSLLCTAGLAHANIFTFNVTLDGPSESPPNSTTGTGTAVVTIDDTAFTMRLQINFSGLSSNDNAAHIHAATTVPFTGTAGVATVVPAFPGFPLGVTSGTYDQTLLMTSTSNYNASYITANGGTATSAFTALTTAAKNGQAYLNIHTTNFGGGEIRGFLIAVPEPGTVALLLAGLAGLAFFRKRA